MARPRTAHPTPAELEALKVLWDRGPSTVREVMDALESSRRSRAYTSVMSLLNVMAEKRLVARKPQGRAFLYAAAVPREKTLNRLVSDLWRRAFEQSASTMVAHLLEETSPSEEELRAIREAIEAYRKEREDE
ncbi:MAG: BlaI/MecI/CopY family transcriptional regulator [Planctomycetaceae bacterium]